MVREYLRQRRLRLAQTIALVGAQLYLAARAAGLLLGPVGVIVVIAAAVASTMHALGTQRLMMPAGTRRIPRWEAPDLHAMIADLATRAGVEHLPGVLLVPHDGGIALTTGVGDRTEIVVSTGLLRRLSPREIRAVLAHEMAHIANRDVRLFALAAAMQRITHVVSVALTGLFVVGLPLLLVGAVSMPTNALFYLAAVPIISLTAQFALLRTREFQADLDAIALTADPDALASALGRLDRRNGLLGMVIPGTGERRGPFGGLLRTHPDTAERIERIREVARGERNLSSTVPITSA